jgi:hypothetical protein
MGGLATWQAQSNLGKWTAERGKSAPAMAKGNRRKQL